MGGFDSAVRGGIAGQLVPLDCRGNGVLAGESAGVVDAQGGVGGHIDGKADIVLVVGIGPVGPDKAQHSQGRAAQSQRRHDERVRSGCADLLALEASSHGVSGLRATRRGRKSLMACA